MKTTIRILSIVIILALLAACTPAPTPPALPTATPNTVIVSTTPIIFQFAPISEEIKLQMDNKKPIETYDVIPYLDINNDKQIDSTEDPRKRTDLKSAFFVVSIPDVYDPQPSSILLMEWPNDPKTPQNEKLRIAQFYGLDGKTGEEGQDTYEISSKYVMNGDMLSLEYSTVPGENTATKEAKVFMSLGIVPANQRPELATLVSLANGEDPKASVEASQKLIDILNSDPGEFTIVTNNIKTGQQTQTTTPRTTIGAQEPSVGESILALFAAKPVQGASEPTPTTEPTPTVELEVPLELQKVTIEAAKNFANAMTAAGTPITFEEVLNQGLVIEQHEENGNKFEVATSQGYPLMIKMEGGEWKMATIGDSAAPRGVNTGIAASNSSPEYRREVLKFNAYTSAWEANFNHIEPNEGMFSWKDLDSFVAFAQKTNTPVRIQDLVYGNPGVIPDWLKEVDSARLMEVMKEHIRQITTRYKGKVDSYNVVNEPFGVPWAQNYFWNEKLNGTEWIDIAFRTAKENDPNARLIFNEAGIEFPGYENPFEAGRSDSRYQLIKTMKDGGTPIDAVGFQMHLYAKDFVTEQDLDNRLTALRSNIQRYQDLGIEVDITEFDVRVNELEGMTASEKLTLQAKIYKEVMKVCLQQGVTNISFFSLTDETSWLKDQGVIGANETMFQTYGVPKISYYEVMRALIEE